MAGFLPRSWDDTFYDKLTGQRGIENDYTFERIVFPVINLFTNPEKALDRMGFAHTQKKQSRGKSGLDKHDKQYSHGGKNRPVNRNQRKGAEERKIKGKRIN